MIQHLLDLYIPKQYLIHHHVTHWIPYNTTKWITYTIAVTAMLLTFHKKIQKILDGGVITSIIIFTIIFYCSNIIIMEYIIYY